MSAAEQIHPEFIYQRQLMTLTQCKQKLKLQDYLDKNNIKYGFDNKGNIYSTVTWFNASKLAQNDEEFEL